MLGGMLSPFHAFRRFKLEEQTSTLFRALRVEYVYDYMEFRSGKKKKKRKNK